MAMNTQQELITHKEIMLAYAKRIYLMEEIARHTKDRKKVPLALEELEILNIALIELHNREVRRLERSKQPRNIKQTQGLGGIQQLLQYIAFVKNEWKENRWEEST